MIKFYHVHTIAKENHKDVPIIWFCKRPDLAAHHGPYEEFIEGFSPDGGYGYAQEAIDELFTAEEANALKNYIDREHGDDATTTITEASLKTQWGSRRNTMTSTNSTRRRATRCRSVCGAYGSASALVRTPGSNLCPSR
jgi:hypothetical protein